MKSNDSFVHNLRSDFHMTQRTLAPVRFSDGLTGSDKASPFVIALSLEVAKITAVFMYEEDTIAAIATPIGEGGVAIVRVSGPNAERIASRIFVLKGAKNG